MPKSKILIYTDFDGTVTKRAGQDTVFKPFYQSLLQGYTLGVVQDYKNTPLKEDTQSLFEAQFGKYDEQFNHTQADVELLMSPDAVAFFHEALKHDGVKVNIITKNRSDYIKAMFKYQGFSETEINKLCIRDSGNKFVDVCGCIRSEQEKTERILILDDSGSDCKAMVQAATHEGYTEEQITAHNLAVGAFEWSKYQHDIQQLFPAISHLPSEQSILATEVATAPIEPSTLATEVAAAPIEPSTLATEVVAAPASRRTFNITAIAASIGLAIGFLVGIALVATGIFAPFGLGVLGAVAVGASLGGGAAVVSASVGYSVAQGTQAEVEVSPDSKGVDIVGSNVAMGGLGSSIPTVAQATPEVQHFASILPQSAPKTVPPTHVVSDPDPSSTPKL